MLGAGATKPDARRGYLLCDFTTSTERNLQAFRAFACSRHHIDIAHVWISSSILCLPHKVYWVRFLQKNIYTFFLTKWNWNKKNWPGIDEKNLNQKRKKILFWNNICFVSYLTVLTFAAPLFLYLEQRESSSFLFMEITSGPSTFFRQILTPLLSWGRCTINFLFV